MKEAMRIIMERDDDLDSIVALWCVGCVCVVIDGRCIICDGAMETVCVP